jgi:hypothetical protein
VRGTNLWRAAHFFFFFFFFSPVFSSSRHFLSLSLRKYSSSKTVAAERARARRVNAERVWRSTNKEKKTRKFRVSTKKMKKKLREERKRNERKNADAFTGLVSFLGGRISEQSAHVWKRLGQSDVYQQR